MAAHALLAPSSAARWMRCAGSVAASQDTPNESSVYAREGSAAHVLGERALQYEKRTEFWLGEVIEIEGEEFIVDDEMCENVQVYVDQVRREPGELLIEQEFDLSEVYGVAKQFGTGDAVVKHVTHLRIEFVHRLVFRPVQILAWIVLLVADE